MGTCGEENAGAACERNDTRCPFSVSGFYEGCNTSFVILDPKGEILRDTGALLESEGYEVRVLDLISMHNTYSELLNSLDSGATTKITINNRRLNRLDFEKTILIPTKGDELDMYREEYNKMLLEKATGANSIVQDKYVTISINKKNVEDARTYFARVGADLIAHFGRLGSKCVELETDERLRIIHDFYRVGEESSYHFDIKETRKKGHSFKDYVCPDTMEFEKDYFKMGNRYGRVLFLREYASYIKDSMVAELTDMNRNLMMSIDVVPVPTDEAVREAESRLLGVETNITNWQRRQNSNNNFSATVEGNSGDTCRTKTYSVGSASIYGYGIPAY